MFTRRPERFGWGTYADSLLKGLQNQDFEDFEMTNTDQIQMRMRFEPTTSGDFRFYLGDRQLKPGALVELAPRTKKEGWRLTTFSFCPQNFHPLFQAKEGMDITFGPHVELRWPDKSEAE